MLKKYIAAVFLLFLISCETEITNFNTKNLSNAIAIYGEMNNLLAPFKVRINRTSSYSPYDLTQFQGEPVKNAMVRILDGNGQIIPFSETSSGYYESKSILRGVVGQKYKLQVTTTDGLEIESEYEELKPAPELIDFKYEFVDAKKVEDMGFKLNAAIKDNKNTEDYYFIKRQDFIQFLTTCPEPPPPPAPVPPCYTKCWRAPLNTQPILLNDFLINGKNIPLGLGTVKVEDITDWVVQLEVFSVSKSIFSYWQRQEDQRNIGGGLFDKVPAQIVGNLSCKNKPKQEVLGVFLVGGVNKQRLTINRFDSFSEDTFKKVQYYVDFNNIRNKDAKLWDCKNAAFIDYNLGHTLPILEAN